MRLEKLFNQSEETIQKRIEDQNQQILQLEQRLKQLKDEASIAQDNFDSCRLSTDTDSLESYHHARSQTKRPPYIVAKISQNTCEGCHLKVSK